MTHPHPIIELSDSTAKERVQEHKVSVVDVYASWCGSCRLFFPSFEKAASENSDFQFFKLDGEKNPDFSALIGPDSIPYVAVFVNGELVGGKTCSKKEVLDEMIQTIRKNLE